MRLRCCVFLRTHNQAHFSLTNSSHATRSFFLSTVGRLRKSSCGHCSRTHVRKWYRARLKRRDYRILLSCNSPADRVKRLLPDLFTNLTTLIIIYKFSNAKRTVKPRLARRTRVVSYTGSSWLRCNPRNTTSIGKAPNDSRCHRSHDLLSRKGLLSLIMHYFPLWVSASFSFVANLCGFLKEFDSERRGFLNNRR